MGSFSKYVGTVAQLAQGSRGRLPLREYSRRGQLLKTRGHRRLACAGEQSLPWAAEGGCPYVSILAVGSFSKHVGTGASPVLASKACPRHARAAALREFRDTGFPRKT